MSTEGADDIPGGRWRRVATMTREELEQELQTVRRQLSMFGAMRARSTRLNVDGRPLAVALAEAQWTQAELAAAVGVSQAVVSAWCSGARKMAPGKAREVIEVFQQQGATPPTFSIPQGRRKFV